MTTYLFDICVVVLYGPILSEDVDVEESSFNMIYTFFIS